MKIFKFKNIDVGTQIKRNFITNSVPEVIFLSNKFLKTKPQNEW